MFRILFIVIIAAYTGSCFAQHNPGPPDPEKDLGWFAFGVGGNSDEQISVVESLNFGHEYILQISGSGNGIFSTVWSSFAISGGYSMVDRWGRVAFFGGPALISFERAGKDNEFGIRFSSQFIFTPVIELGIGVELWTVISSTLNVAGISAILVIEGNK